MAIDWKITLSDLAYGAEEQAAVAATLEAKWLTMGPRVEAFESALSARLGGAGVVCLSSCTAALHLALLALGVGPGDEVIVPSLTFAATANVVAMAGARPVFCDIIDPREPTLDPADVAARISPRARVIVPMHYAGFSCRMLDLLRVALAAPRPLRLLEDAAHAFGGHGGSDRPLGAMGDAGALSFFSNKNLAVGEGGAFVSPDPELVARVRRLRSHGMTASTWHRHKGGGAAYDVVEPGLNYRPTEITAALGLCQLEKFDGLQRRRAALWRQYVARLAPLPGVELPFEGRSIEGRPAWHIFPVLLPDEARRDRVADALQAAGIQTSHHYRPLHQMTAYSSATRPLPKTEAFAARELTLPLHPGMTDSDVDLVADTLRKAL